MYGHDDRDGEYRHPACSARWIRSSGHPQANNRSLGSSVAILVAFPLLIMIGLAPQPDTAVGPHSPGRGLTRWSSICSCFRKTGKKAPAPPRRAGGTAPPDLSADPEAGENGSRRRTVRRSADPSAGAVSVPSVVDVVDRNRTGRRPRSRENRIEVPHIHVVEHRVRPGGALVRPRRLDIRYVVLRADRQPALLVLSEVELVINVLKSVYGYSTRSLRNTRMLDRVVPAPARADGLRLDLKEIGIPGAGQATNETVASPARSCGRAC
jgi:hypothetical protein